MSKRSLSLILLCLLAVAGAWLFWPHAKRATAKKFVAPTAATVRAASTAPKNIFAAGAGTNHVVTVKTNQFAYRLSNTSKTIGQLTSDRHAILLENALIDTGVKLNLSIPKHLAAAGDPGAFIVQARGPIDGAFRAALAAAGAQVVSYIPNDAYLVRLSAGQANGLAANPLVSAVLPYEPYYKVQPSLLPLAVKEQPLAAGTFLTLGLFADGSAATVAAIEKLGGKIVGEDRSPFGPIVRVQPPVNWLPLVRLSGVQIVEPATRRVLANDLTRVTVGVTTDTTSAITNNYLGLTGKNVLVEVNDSGIDATHPDFTATGAAATGPAGATRVFADSTNSTVDVDGHGTHVAGIIAGNGAESLTLTNVPQGSVTNADFRGKAPLATLFSVGFLGANDFSVSDEYLQVTPARTNALISNNSWVNGGSSEYDLSAAGFDAAVRDALPKRTGPQPVLFVFAAGNDGSGDDGGGGGTPDSIASPGTAKNVITVGALEQLRGITNWVTALDGTSNQVWLPETDSSQTVAWYSSRGNVGIGTEGTYGRFKPDVVAPGTFVVSTRSSQWDQNAYYNPTNYYDNFALNQVVNTNHLNYYAFSDFGFVVKSNAVNVSLSVYNASPAVDLPIYVSLANYPNPPDATTYDFVRNNTVTIPPDGGAGYLASIIGNFGDFNFAIADSTNVPVTYDLHAQMVTTNDLGDFYTVLSNLNQTISPWYRYETGTSMAAPAVSGVLALMQDYFTNTLNTTPSPALLKAMLINGARPTSFYNFQVNNPINFEGWGLINLPNSLPLSLTNTAASATNSTLFFVDQALTNALATGDRRTYSLTLSPAAQNVPLRFTLAWTDPPGNPAAAIKLVNNLDLIVTNTDNSANPIVYYGNDIAANQVFNTQENPTNPAPNLDTVNNVENVFLPAHSGTNFTVVIYGTAVNVNAVTTTQTNSIAAPVIFAPDIVQDFAFVVSSGNGANPNGFKITASAAASNPLGDQRITVITSTNPAPLLDQFVGASSPLLGTNTVGFGANSKYGAGALVTLGQTNQCHFYIVTNYGTSADFTNAAFVTFLPPTLALPRGGVFANSDAHSTRPEADIDLFVASGPGAWALTNLDATVIFNCVNHAQVGKSNPQNINGVFYGADLGRGGSDYVVDTNSTPGQVYYICVQSQDQMGSEYDFLAEFSNIPFSSLDNNGNEYVRFYPVEIPDGDAPHPGYTNTIGLAIFPITVERAVDTNVLSQQNVGDLVIALNHPTTAAGNGSVVLLNHDAPNFPGVFTNIYDDSGQGDIQGSQRSDGPGSLTTFAQQEGSGIWILHAADSAPGFSGSITNNSLFLQKHIDLAGVTNITVVIPANSWFYDYVDVPAGYTNLFLFAIDETVTSVQLTLAEKYGSAPTTNNADQQVQLTIPTISPPGLSNSISVGPPLTPGTYYVGVYNPDTVPHTVELGARLGFSAAAETTVDYASTDTPIFLPDDALTSDFINVTNTDIIEGFNVGLRVDHPRISDLAFTLVSPSGARYALMENRGAYTTNGCGLTTITTNIVNINATGGPKASTNFIFTGKLSGKISISYDMFPVPDEMTVYYSTNLSTPALAAQNLITNFFTSGAGQFTVSFPPPGVPATSDYLTIVMNATNHPSATRWVFTAGGVETNYFYLRFTEDTNQTTTPIKYALPPFVPLVTTYTEVWTDSFELYPDNIYTNGAVFGPWTVLTNQVNIATNPIAADGTNLLALNNGAVSTTLPTIPGRKYTLQYSLGTQPFAGLFVANINDGTTWTYALPNPNGTQFASGFQSPVALAFDSSGNLYVANFGSGFGDGSIQKITLGGVTNTILSGLNGPAGLAFDLNGNLYEANYSDNTIWKITPAGVASIYETDPTSSFLNGPRGLAFDGNGILYVANYNDNEIRMFSAANTTGTRFVIDPGTLLVLSSPVALAFDSTGTNLFVANSGAGASTPGFIEEFQTPNPIGIPIILSLATPAALAFDSSDNLFIADAYGGTNSSGIIYEYTTNSVLNIFTTNDLNAPFGLAYYSNINSEAPNSAAWQVQSLTFTATQTNTPLVLDASRSGFAAGTLVSTNFSALALFDAFSLTLIPSELYYQAEQSLAPVIGTSAFGDWEMEVLDRRTGATDTNASLVSWQLEFIFANTNQAIAALGTLSGGTATNNSLGAAGLGYYVVNVPPQASYATNFLLSASSPVNVWFSTAFPPTITSPGDVDLIPNSINNIATPAILSTNGSPVFPGPPNIIPGSTYYLVIQNLTNAPVTFNVKVNFDVVGQFSSLHFSGVKTSASHPQMSWVPGFGGHYQIQWADQFTSPMVWHTITNPVTTTVHGTSTFTDNGTQTAPLGAKRFYRLVKTK